MPSFLYYIGLYVIIVLTNYFRLKGEQSNDATPEYKFPWKKIFFVSNEVIYTGSGVYIVLLTNQIWVGPIMVFLILLIVVSLYMIAMESKFSDNVKFFTHITIILIVITATFSFFTHKITSENTNQEKQYKVSFPYFDKSMAKKYGYDKFGDTYLSYTTGVMAKNEEDAISFAVRKFWSDSLVEPLFLNPKEKMTKQQLLKIDNNNIIAKELNLK